jgi:hypothetical protein
MSELRPLRWHDLPFVYRLAGRGISFDAHLGLIVGEDNLRHAQLTGIGRTQLYVLRRRGGQSGMASLYYPDGDQHARLAYIAPILEDCPDESLWLEMLDGLTACAGQRGTLNIAAEVDEHSPALEIMRQADFAIYARQDLWARQPAPIEGPALKLREARPEDESALIGLYGMLVPALIKQVEPPPFTADGCYLLDGREGPSAMVVFYRGNRRALAEVYLHPEVDLEAREVINGALELLGATEQLVYIRLRRYIGWLDGALVDLGFEKIGSQAVMVRHTTVRAKAQHSFKPLPAMDSMLVPTPISDLPKNIISLPQVSQRSE